jgi:hypothetical protein
MGYECHHDLSHGTKRFYFASDLSLDISCKRESSKWKFLDCNGTKRFKFSLVQR